MKHEQKCKSFQNILCKVFKKQQPSLSCLFVMWRVWDIGCSSLSEFVRWRLGTGMRIQGLWHCKDLLSPRGKGQGPQPPEDSHWQLQDASAYFRAEDCGAVTRDIIFISFVVEALCLMPRASFTGALVERTLWAVAAAGNLTLPVPDFGGCAWEVRRAAVVLVRRWLKLIQWRRPPHSLNAAPWQGQECGHCFYSVSVHSNCR